MISLFFSYTCLDKNVPKMCLPLIWYNTIKLFCLRFNYNVFLMYFHSHYIEYKNFIQDILIPLLSSVNVFTYTEKGQQFGGIFDVDFSLEYFFCSNSYWICFRWLRFLILSVCQQLWEEFPSSKSCWKIFI